MRTLTPELMDDPGASPGELREALGYLAAINARFGGARALIAFLERESRSWVKGETISLLDVATGGADIPIAVARWAERTGIDVRITAVDLHETTLSLARENLERFGAENPPAAARITLLRADALRMAASRAGDAASPEGLATFEPSSFDYAHASLFLHHLPELSVLTALRVMDRLARRGVVWNDLVRSPLCRAIVRVATVGTPRIVKHDAVVSVGAGFTKREALDAAARAGLERLEWRRVWVYRFAVVGR